MRSPQEPHEARVRLPQLRLDELLEELQARLDAARGTRDRVHSLLKSVLSVLSVLSAGRELELELAERCQAPNRSPTIFGLRSREIEGASGLRARAVRVAGEAAPLPGFAPSVRMEDLVDTHVPREIADHVVAVPSEALTTSPAAPTPTAPTSSSRRPPTRSASPSSTTASASRQTAAAVGCATWRNGPNSSVVSWSWASRRRAAPRWCGGCRCRPGSEPHRLAGRVILATPTALSADPTSSGDRVPAHEQPTGGPDLDELRRRTAAAVPRREAGMVVCENLVRIYQTEGVEVQALQGLDLTVAQGEMVAVIGASGSGKSTLLGILSGQDMPTAGAAEVAGHDLLAMKRRERLSFRRGTVGFVWQQNSRNLLPYLSAAENVMLPMTYTGIKRSRRRARAEELLDLLSVGHCRDRTPDTLSGGEQQRVAIAVANANEPKVLFADEPTGELDTATSDEVFAALRRANEELGVTVVVVTHDALVSEQVQRTVRIRNGRTSTEVLRRIATDEDGAQVLTAEEYAVLDASGRLQLPSEFTERLHLRKRVRLVLESDHVGVWPDEAARRARADAQDAASGGPKH